MSCLCAKRIRELQDKKIKAFIRYRVWPYHPYYRRLFKKNNIDPYSITTTDDLAKIPFTSKEDIAQTKKEPNKHTDFILQPNQKLIKEHYNKVRLIGLGLLNIFSKGYLKNSLEREYKPVHIHFTTGRSALPVPFTYSAQDIERLKESGRRMFDVFNAERDDVVINAFPYSPHLAFWQAFYGIKACNLLSLQTGGGKVLGTEKIINGIEKMKANIFVAIPGYAYHLIRKAAEEKRNFSNLKKIIFGGERIPPGLRKKIGELLVKLKCRNARILSTYAFTEGKVAWSECCADSGYHLYPDMEFIEIIKDGERVNDGEEGEITYTALDWRASTVLRYKTGDIGSLSYEKCPNCGRTVPRINAKIERKSDLKRFNLTKVKGTLINLNFFFPFLMGNKDIDEWQVVIKKRRDDPYEVDELMLYIAPKKKVDRAKLKFNLKHQIRDKMEVTPYIIITDREDLLEKLGMETELKEKRIVDIRPR